MSLGVPVSSTLACNKDEVTVPTIGRRALSDDIPGMSEFSSDVNSLAYSSMS